MGELDTNLKANNGRGSADRELSDPTRGRVSPGVLRRVGLVLGAVVVITIAHLTTPPSYVFVHSILQHLYYLPIILGAVFFGWPGGLLTAVCASMCYVPHIHQWEQLDHPYALNQYAELGSFLLVGLATGLLADREHRRARQLERKTEELERANRDLEESFNRGKEADRLAAVGQLAAGLAHEIRHPLASIEGAINVLANPRSPDDLQDEFRGILKKECHRLGVLLTELLHFSRPSKPKLQKISIAACIEDVIHLAKSSFATPGTEIEADVAAGMPMIECDEEQMKRALLNLIINGVQSTPIGGHVKVAAYVEDSHFVLVVSDDGPGIPKDMRSRIFDPFFTTRESGTGLGLAVVQQIVRQHGGAVEVGSANSTGASFTIRIPIRDERRP